MIEQLITEIIIECSKTTNKLGFDEILKYKKKELINKVVDVGVEKYKFLFKKDDNSEIKYENYLKYIKLLSDFIEKNFIKKEILNINDLLNFHQLIYSIFPNEKDKLESGKIRTELRTIENFDETGKLIQRDIFISKNKVKKFFLKEINDFNKNIKTETFKTIIHFFQWNLSKIHPFYNGNGRLFFILLDIFLIKYNYLPLFIRQNKNEYENITRQYMIDKNFKKLEINFLKLILNKYKNYKIK